MKNFEIDIEYDTDTGEIKIAEQTPNTEDQQTDSQKEPVAAEELPRESNKPSENEAVTDATETPKNHSHDHQTEHNVDIVEQAIRMSNCFVMIPKLKQTHFPY